MRSNKINKNIIVYVVVFFIVFFIEFGLNSYLSFSLDESSYLFYQNIINVLGLFTTLIGFGTPFAVVYMTSLKRVKTNFILTEANLFVIYFFITIMTVIYVGYLTSFIPLYVVVATVLGFFNAIKQNSVNYFLARKEINKSSFVRFNQKLIYIIIVLLLLNLFIETTVYSLGTYLILGEIVGFLILLYMYKIITLKKLTKIKSILTISKYSFLANVIGMIGLSLPILMLNYFHYDSTDIINFSIAFVLLKYSGVLLGPFMQLITPYFTPIKNDMVKLQVVFKKYFILVFILGLIVSSVMYLLSDLIIGTFFANTYSEAISLFKVLVFAIPFLFLNSFVISFISSTFSIKQTSKLTFITMSTLFFSLLWACLYHASIYYVTYIIVGYYILCDIVSILYVKRALDEIY